MADCVNPNLIVVTAASSNHAGALRQLLESLRRLDARVECYDIGLTAAEARALPRWPGLWSLEIRLRAPTPRT